MLICISGSRGFVGTNLMTYLKEGAYTLCPLILRHDHPVSLPPKAEVVIHLAGKAHDLKKVTRIEEYYEVNTELTKQIFDAFLRSDAKVFITLSSVKAVADTVRGSLTEEALPQPCTVYGKSKLLAEQYLIHRVIPEGKRVYILRPCIIHGPGNKGNLTLLFKFLSKRLPWPLAAFHNQRSFLSIDNLCFVIKELIDRADIPPGIYNLADDQPLSTHQLIELIASALGFKARLWHIPKKIIQGIAQLGNILRLPLNTDRLQKLTENYVVSNEKIKAALKKSLPISAEVGILKTIHSFTKTPLDAPER